MYLIDTNVISEVRKIRKADPSVLRWFSAVHTSSLYLSVMTIYELEVGALGIARRDPVQGEILRAWINQYVLPEFSERILLIDTAVALRSAVLNVPNPRPQRDALIAATALVHGMTVVTRNIADFEPMGVSVINPWTASH